MIFGLLKALALTILVEGITAWLFQVRSVLDQLTLLGINCITNPIINLLMILVANRYGISTIWYIVLIGLEMTVVIVEAFMIQKLMEVKNHWLLSLIINLMSFLIGLLIL